MNQAAAFFRRGGSVVGARLSSRPCSRQASRVGWAGVKHSFPSGWISSASEGEASAQEGESANASTKSVLMSRSSHRPFLPTFVVVIACSFPPLSGDICCQALFSRVESASDRDLTGTRQAGRGCSLKTSALSSLVSKTPSPIRGHLAEALHFSVRSLDNVCIHSQDDSRKDPVLWISCS